MTECQSGEQSFLAFTAKTWRRCYSQLGQDLWVLWQLEIPEKGYFVDIGAYDGVTISNTYLLEKLGWSGIAIEANPAVFEVLARNRACESILAAVTDSDDNETLLHVVPDKPELTRLAAVIPEDSHENSGARGRHETVTVPSARIGSLLERVCAPARFEYLSLDTEGSELEILKSFPFDRWRPMVITVEHNFTPARRDIHEFLQQAGYKRTLDSLSEFDDWYVDGDARDPRLDVSVAGGRIETLLARAKLVRPAKGSRIFTKRFAARRARFKAKSARSKTAAGVGGK